MDLFSVKTPEDVDTLINIDGHNINARNDSCYTPLHIACAKGLANIVEKLCVLGADMNVIDVFGDTPLHIACSNEHNEHFDVIKKLCSLGANIDAKNIGFSKPIDNAALAGNLNIVKYFIEKYGIISDELLHNSLISESIDVFDYVLTLNPDLNQKVDEKTPLNLACELDNIYCVDKLLYAGADVNIVDSYGENVLINICSKNITEQTKGIINRLLFFGVDINQQTNHPYKDSYSSLHYICEKQNMLDIVKILISQKADVNLVTDTNDTPLMLAYNNNNYEYIPYLLEAGADGTDLLDFCDDEKTRELIMKYVKN